MLMKGTLNAHLEGVDRQTDEMEQQLISQLAQRENVTEQFNAENQLKWVRRMINIRNCAEKIFVASTESY